MKRSGMLSIAALSALLAVFLFGIWRAQPPPDLGQAYVTANMGANSTANIWGANSTTVIIDGFAFYPAVLTVPKGTTVTWTNKYPVAHRVSSNVTSPNFTSPSLSTGASFTWTFPDSGNFTYYCSLHPTMNGTIVVK
jgi:plastocyanin